MAVSVLTTHGWPLSLTLCSFQSRQRCNSRPEDGIRPHLPAQLGLQHAPHGPPDLDLALHHGPQLRVFSLRLLAQLLLAPRDLPPGLAGPSNARELPLTPPRAPLEPRERLLQTRRLLAQRQQLAPLLLARSVGVVGAFGGPPGARELRHGARLGRQQRRQRRRLGLHVHGDVCLSVCVALVPERR